MKSLSESASYEVATSSCFLQNAAHQPRLLWEKRMLYVLVSMLCASCGNSGIPSDSESTSGLQNSESITQITASDSIIGPGFSGFSVSEAQEPTIAAAEPVLVDTTTQPVLLAAAETDVVAPGQSVSTALQSLGNVVSTPEKPVSTALQQLGTEVITPETTAPVATPEVSVSGTAPEETIEEPPQVAVIPDASETSEIALTAEEEAEMEALAAELAALEAELAALPPTVEILPLAEPEDEDDGSGTTTSKTVSYQSIKANGLGNGTYPTDDYYLAEFLYQNPDVCFWEQDKKNKTITSLATPAPPEDSVYMPSPTGGDDTSMLESFFKKNAGKSVVGEGTYMVKTLDISNKIDIHNMSMVPAPGAKQMVRITAPDVRIFNSPIDGKNSSTLAVGYNVEDGAHRFVLVGGGLKNIHHKSQADATGVFVRGANDFYIVCNRFENLINDTSDKSKTARVNSTWLNGRKTHSLSGGLIANNYADNHQSNGRLVDAEFFTIQSYSSVSEDNPVRVFANRAYNAGKRFTKNQESNTLILSNYVEWNTKTGPLGRRKLLSAFEIHVSDNVIVRNNRISVSAEGHFDSIFQTDASTGTHTAHLGGRTQNNIHFDNNDIELKDNRDPNARSGPVLISATASHVDIQAVGHEAKNSSANNNNVYGSGSLRNYFLFRNGYDDHGGRFEHKDNVFSVPAYQSDYRVF